MTSCFNIFLSDWVVLFVFCVAVVRDIGAFSTDLIFTFFCIGLLGITCFATVLLLWYFYEMILDSFHITNPHDYNQLQDAVRRGLMSQEAKEARDRTLRRWKMVTVFRPPPSQDSETQHHYFRDLLSGIKNPQISISSVTSKFNKFKLFHRNN
jgi:hypothetical protein